MAQKLISISDHLAGAAEFGAATAHRLLGIAHDHSQKIDDASPEDTASSMARVWPIDSPSIKIYPLWNGEKNTARYKQTLGFGNFGNMPGKDLLDSEVMSIRLNPSSETPYGYQPPTSTSSAQANFENLTLKRALTVSRGIQVQVRSWNKVQGRSFTASYPSNSVPSIQAGRSKVGSGAQVYKRTIRPNLTQQQAIDMAMTLYNQLIAHEMKFDNLELPGDNDLDITSMINLSGTGTAFDQAYFVDCIHRRMSFDYGYAMTVSGKNHNTDSEIGNL